MSTLSLVALVSMGAGVALGAIIATSKCEAGAWWNLLASWRALKASSQNPLLYLISPEASGASGYASRAVFSPLAAGATAFVRKKKKPNTGGDRKTLAPGERQKTKTIGGVSRIDRRGQKRDCLLE